MEFEMKTKTLITCLSVSLTMIFAASCGEDEGTPAPGESSVSKLEAAAQGGKSDRGVDFCEANGWYGDGECDTFCPKADTDCDGAYEPCGTLSCGETCTLCAPGDKNCIETAVVKMCQDDGTCGATTPTCGATDEPYDSCGGKTCGDYCTICDPADTDCFETAVVKYCQADGSCGATEAVCEVTEPYDSCGGKTCGDTCTICDPADTDCFETAVVKYCHADGSCSPLQATCDIVAPYDPCGGKMCGDACTVCDPADTDCFETAVLKFCSDEGTCNAGDAVCSI
jgi:hypothetical protein